MAAKSQKDKEPLQFLVEIFLAQLHGVDLNITRQSARVLIATLASIGTTAVPGAGLIMLIIVLQSVGLNPAWIALIFPVDRYRICAGQ